MSLLLSASLAIAIMIGALVLGTDPVAAYELTQVRAESPAQTAKLTASLIDPEKKAQEKTASVEVKVQGIQLVDPATTGERPVPGQGHLHYRVDDGPVIATTSTKLSFHELARGEHRISVMLASNDHKPLGPEQTLTVKVP